MGTYAVTGSGMGAAVTGRLRAAAEVRRGPVGGNGTACVLRVQSLEMPGSTY